MSTEIGSYDAKTKLPEILRRVEKGESFTITNRGRPIADLVPSRSAQSQQTKRAINNIREMDGKYTISDDAISELKSRGRR
ncbi:MAG: type II toxin-antitoxin system prevent-host-death family antitoxin [Gammaproteobacteria bacterium]|jgi:prevent-host-death family protein|nr:type II toxin-antitoxin system prevent-host-death family antitoxin [Gammaproteobacteria bacterium]MBT7371641.1 type II toxin-antitoxin system prevent-host-death family antitoxin [Gammaproteobacteria bacterium]